jgi:hypothetical protein
MLTLPAELASAIILFAPLFSKRVWKRAEQLLVGAILAPAHRTVCSTLRVLGLSQEQHFQNYHRVLNRARWSAHQAARLLTARLVASFVPTGVVRVALDDTLERRRGKKIRAKGIYRDAVRSSHSHVVKASGLRWLSLMLLADIPFAQRRWALPMLSVLAPSERYHTEQGRRHKKLTDWGRQMLLELARWLPGRQIVCVADSSFAAIELLAAVREHVTMITRLRLDAALYEPPPPRRAGQPGRPRKKGKRLMRLDRMLTDRRRRWQRLTLTRWYQQSDRLVEVLTGTAVWYHAGLAVVPIRWVLVRDPEGQFPPQAFLTTDLRMTAQQVLEYYVDRWQVEVTFEETRQHLGVETQRQWNDLAIARTTPVLLALYSLVALMATERHARDRITKRSSAWYVKEHVTFSDALAAVRNDLWQDVHSSMSSFQDDIVKIPRLLYQRWLSTLCYAS